MKRFVVLMLMFAARAAVADPAWSGAVRVGAHVVFDSLPDFDGVVEQRYAGPSLEVEVAYRVLPQLAIAVFVRDDHHANDLRTLDDVFVGVRARLYLRPGVFAGAGYAMIDEQESNIDPRRVSAGCEGELGVELMRREHFGLEAVLGLGRFTEAGPMFEGEIAWTQLSLGGRFW